MKSSISIAMLTFIACTSGVIAINSASNGDVSIAIIFTIVALISAFWGGMRAQVHANQ